MSTPLNFFDVYQFNGYAATFELVALLLLPVTKCFSASSPVCACFIDSQVLGMSLLVYEIL